MNITFICFIIVLTISSLQNTFFVSKRATKYCLLKDSLTAILKISLLPFLVSIRAIGIFFSWNIAILITFLVGFKLIFSLQKDYKIRMKISKNVINKMMHFSMGNYFANLFNILPGLVLPLLISNSLYPAMSAYFYIAWTIAGVLFMVAGSTYSSLLVEGSYNKETFKENIKKSVKFIALFILPAIVAIILFGGNILSIFGEDYVNNALNILILLSISSIPYSINYIYMAKLNIEHKIKELLILNVIISTTTLLIAYLFLNKIGIIAAGAGWLLSQIIISIWALIQLKVQK